MLLAALGRAMNHILSHNVLFKFFLTCFMCLLFTLVPIALPDTMNYYCRIVSA